ncbi:GNAT family N-acetyltransferase [Paenibacillus harenae]|uniref:GNAT family N-acetyltransferase n=1 Tax=Paenibacillus harenae TaxID=306543 RepID=UPI0003FC446A|nr:GNAT family N-acetyltransferase [Paenibacillus harenae]
MDSRIEIKTLGIGQYNESMALSQFAFQYRRTEQELEQGKEQFQAEPAARYAAYVDGQFAAQAIVLELETFIGGKRFAMGGLAGVATWPEYRRQGLVAKILIHSLEEMKGKGQTISFLHPFAFAFYRKYGWETYTEHKVYTIKSEQLPPRKPYEGRMERYNGSSSLLNSLYETYASRYNGTLVRTEQWWKNRISKRKPGQTTVFYDNSDTARGYLIYEVKNMQLTVHELVHLTEEARAALWSYIGQHDSMIDTVTMTAPSDDVLPYWLPNPRIKQEIIPYFMARIVDAEAFVAQYAFKAAAGEDQFVIELIDEHAAWNAGRFRLAINASGGASLSRLQQPDRQEKVIQIDIGTLTTILLGYIRPLQLADLNRIHGDAEAINRLQNRIPERTTYLPDFF